MIKQIKQKGQKLKTAYWSMVGTVSAAMLTLQPVMADTIANRSLGNYMPQFKGAQLSETQISGGQISTKVTGADGKSTSVEMFNASQFEKPDAPHSVVTASDGSQWYQMASGSGAGAFYDAPNFTGSPAESAQVAAAFPDAVEGTTFVQLEMAS